jgi:hypothetical protein
VALLWGSIALAIVTIGAIAVRFLR